MVCGVLCSRVVCLDTQMRVHKVLIVDYRIGGKFSLSLPEKIYLWFKAGGMVPQKHACVLACVRCVRRVARRL